MRSFDGPGVQTAVKPADNCKKACAFGPVRPRRRCKNDAIVFPAVAGFLVDGSLADGPGDGQAREARLMGQITSSVGLISGIDTGSIVDQLMALEGRPKILIQRRSSVLTSQQVAFQEINAKLLAFKNAAFNLSRLQTFSPRAATSSNPEVLGITASTTAPVGTHSLTVKQMVSSQHSVSRGFFDRNTTAVAEGLLTFESAQASLKSPVKLADLRGGDGVQRGKIAITDRSGRSAVVDLSDSLTLDDVLNRINNVSGIDVRASLDGDRLNLTDLSGAGASNLIVREVGSGRTASDLGLLMNEASDSVSGQSIRYLGENSSLSQLNEGLGVRTNQSGTADLRITASDASSFDLDVSGLQTIGQVMAAINDHADNPGITVSLNSDGNGLLLADATGGGQAMSVSSLNGSNAALDLGLRGTASAPGADLQGARLIGSLESRLLSNLNGGRGVSFAQSNQTLTEATSLSSLLGGAGVGGNGDLNATDLTITTRNGGTYHIEADKARTVGELADAIHAATRGRVSLSVSGDRLEVRDHTSGVGNFSISDTHGSTLAADLGLAFSTTEDSVTGDALNAQIGTNIQITNRQGVATTVDLTGTQTLDEVIKRINESGAGVRASIADNKTSLLLTDTTGALTGSISVAEVDGTAAADLGLLGTGTGTTLQGGNLERAYMGSAMLLSDLNNGLGLNRGQIRIFDSSGQNTTIDLRSEAIRNLGDVVNAINSGGINVFARINDTGDGLIIDDHGLKSTAMRIEDLSGSSAADLGISGTASVPGASIEGRQQKTVNIGVATMTAETRLADLNGGEGLTGLAQGDDLRIHSADGSAFQLNIRGVQTIADLMQRVDEATGGKIALSIDAAGTGLRWEDQSTGELSFRIEGINGSPLAESLGLVGPEAVEGVIQSSAVTKAATLEHIAQRINDSGVGARAAIINDGSGQNSFRLSIQASKTGEAGAFLFDDGGSGLGVRTMTKASNAVVFYGSSDPAQALIITSTSNSIKDALPGVTLDIKSVSNSPVTININREDAKIVDAVKAFADAANGVFETLDKYDKYDKENEERGLLMGDSAVLRTRATLNRMINGVNRDVDSQYTMLAQVGMRIGSDGKVAFDSERFSAALANDFDAVARLFTLRRTEPGENPGEVKLVGKGVAVALDELLGQMTGVDGVVQRRSDTLAEQIRQNDLRIKAIDQRLAARRLRLEAQFNQMEATLARLQEQQSALGQIQFMQPRPPSNNNQK